MSLLDTNSIQIPGNEAKPRHRSKSVNKNEIRVLVVDDEEVIRRVCELSLKKADFQVESADNGLSALNKIRELDNIEIVISDMKMPGMDGIELLAEIKRYYSHIEVIMMTGFATIENAIEAMKIGAADFIIKPLKSEQIRMVVDRCYEKICSTRQIQRLKDSNAALRQLEAIKDKFLAITSHELRTPVSHLKGYLSILTDEIFNSMSQGEREECMRIIFKAVDDLEEIVTNMFDIVKHKNKKMPLKAERFSLRELLQDIYDEFSLKLRHSQSSRNHELELMVAPEVDKIIADRLKIKVVISNLVQNAIKFTESDGHIVIRCYQENNFVVVSVIDNGIGIPEEEQELIFSKFYEIQNSDHHSTSELDFRGGGMGLGLSIAREIINSHRGGIKVESNVGLGTEFLIYLPLEFKPEL